MSAAIDDDGWDMAAICARLNHIASLTGAPSLTPPSGAHPHQIAQYTNAMFASVPLRMACTQELEAELRSMLVEMLKLPAPTVGVLTGSGTESLLLALAPIRQGSRAGAQIIVASNVHPSVLRAATILGYTPVVTEVDREGRADPRAYAHAIGAATAAVVLSAPAWASGETDPLAEIAALAGDRGVACHVDASIGGMLFPVWTFSARSAPSIHVRGVTSVSVDLHKFGYAPRNLSAVCFNSAAAAEHAAFAEKNWDGFVYRATRLGAEPPFAPIAGSWAVMRALGASGYRRLAQRLCDRRDMLCGQLADSDIEADCAPYAAVLRLRARRNSLQDLSHRLRQRGVHHTLCRPGFLRLRVDPLIEDAEFLELANRLRAAADEK